MKKILSMIAMVAVFGSSNVMADCASDLTDMGLTSSMRSSAVLPYCAYTEFSSIVATAKSKGTKIISATGVTRSVHTKDGTVIKVAGTVRDGMCDNEEHGIKIHFAIIHEMYHAANPGVQSIENETKAVRNTNKLRSKTNSLQRAKYNGTVLSKVCNQ
ncbi:MAG: hypothetical protein COA63_013600 [Methylophaga sp.]|nr:hypothetical protein [Methylophaga sp.]